MDGIFGIGPLELFFIAIIALIVLGPERLPSLLREIAKTIRRLRELTNEFTSQFSDELKALDEINPRKILSDMVDPGKPLPGEKVVETPKATAENKALTPPKPAGPKSQATANAILSSKAATDAARATKAAKEAEAAKVAEAKAAAARAAEATTGDTQTLAASTAVSAEEDAGMNGAPVNGLSENGHAEPEYSILPPTTEAPLDPLSQEDFASPETFDNKTQSNVPQAVDEMLPVTTSLDERA